MRFILYADVTVHSNGQKILDIWSNYDETIVNVYHNSYSLHPMSNVFWELPYKIYNSHNRKLVFILFVSLVLL